jgi:DNA-binding NtrC family response regulator
LEVVKLLEQKVLVIEADRQMNPLYELNLEGHVAEIFFASSVEEASNLALRHKPSVIIVGCDDTFYCRHEIMNFVDSLDRPVPVLYCIAGDNHDVCQDIADRHKKGNYSVIDVFMEGYLSLPSTLNKILVSQN